MTKKYYRIQKKYGRWQVYSWEDQPNVIKVNMPIPFPSWKAALAAVLLDIEMRKTSEQRARKAWYDLTGERT